ncbi:MAG: ribonuclease PH [Deltaproteobacteria bacterium]|nr:ribonuclease PH [Deltaproteobacteria bacterium]
MRKDGRSAAQLRPIRMIPGYSSFSDGSVLIETGETRVLCTVNFENSVPPWLRYSRANHGWLTAEYSMLPGATQERTKRERGHLGGRTQEIQRLIGRALRGILDLNKFPDATFVVDCDVLQADGGTRTASITGGFVALNLAINKLLREGRLKHNPIREAVAAVSVGIKDGAVLVDLNYGEDSTVDLDMNIVMTQSGKLLEIQGTAEKSSFTKEQVLEIVTAAEDSLKGTFDLQKTAADGQEVEG